MSDDIDPASIQCGLQASDAGIAKHQPVEHDVGVEDELQAEHSSERCLSRLRMRAPKGCKRIEPSDGMKMYWFTSRSCNSPPSRMEETAPCCARRRSMASSLKLSSMRTARESPQVRAPSEDEVAAG